MRLVGWLVWGSLKNKWHMISESQLVAKSRIIHRKVEKLTIEQRNLQTAQTLEWTEFKCNSRNQ